MPTQARNRRVFYARQPLQNAHLLGEPLVSLTGAAISTSRSTLCDTLDRIGLGVQQKIACDVINARRAFYRVIAGLLDELAAR